MFRNRLKPRAAYLMGAFIVALLGAIVLGATGCVHGDGKGVNWPAYVECAPDVTDVITTVSRVLLADGTNESISDRGRRELSGLAVTHGAGTIACLVKQLISDWTSPGASQDPLVLASATRGRAFLAEIGTVAKLEEPW